MSRVNFRNIAILDARLLPPEKDDVRAGVQRWEETAFKAGMDACYLRLHGSDPKIINLALESINPSLPKILPCSIQADFSDITGIHFKEHEEITDVAPELLRGKSCHSLESVLDAQNKGLDYVFFSPIFETKTHPEAVGVGLKTLEEVCAATDIPVFALGGINEDNQRRCLDAGAHGVAAISMFCEEKS